MLQAIGAVEPPNGDDDACQLIMPLPPSPQISEADKACITDWVQQFAEAPEPIDNGFEATPLRASLQKVKTLMRGDAVTPAELAQVRNANNEQTAMRDLYRSWAEGDAFDTKMMNFLEVSLQQRLQNFEAEQFDRLRVNGSIRTRIQQVMEESFVRTALHMIHAGEPFNQVARTQTWMVTTANLVLLGYGDQTEADRNQRHLVFTDPADAPRRLRNQVDRRRWFIDRPEAGNCDLPQTAMINFLFGVLRGSHCPDREFQGNTLRSNLELAPINPEDFEDWRLVTFVYDRGHAAEDMIPFYDLPRLRAAEEIPTRLPRVGYFTTNAFFENWLTNVDNQFRVAVNQSMLAGLQMEFVSSEPTDPLSTDAIDQEHAATAECYGCHRQIDPMRVYFSKSFNLNYQRPFGDEEDAPILRGLRPGFAFRGVQREGGDLRRFGRLIAEHPRFAAAWVQKLCSYANSARCNETDPVFQGIVRRFRNRGFDFKTMMVELYASPLVSGRAELDDESNTARRISITRRDHLCSLLSERTGRANLCAVRRIRSIIGLIPNDDFARGAVEATMPARPSPIYLAAAESVCNAVARTVVTANGNRYRTNRPGQAIDRIVNELMALSGEPARAARAHDILTDHFDQAVAGGADRLTALRSTFAIACVSPDVMGVGL